MQNVTPKQVAKAIGVSESSLKRWCDQGLLLTERTPGGHRRLPLHGVLDFLRSSGRQLTDPSVLGLPSNVGQGDRTLERAANQVCESLLAGDEEQARQIIFDLYLARQSAAVICDRVLAPAMYRIGDCWECGDAEVYQERQSCEMLLRILHELRRLLPAVDPERRCLGATPAHDHYCLPGAMVELVLRDNGWSATSLGTGLPFETLIAAVMAQRPQLFWLSVSHIADLDEFLTGYAKLSKAALETGTALIVGGQALTTEIRKEMTYSSYCDTLQQLVRFGETLAKPRKKPSTQV